MKIFSFWRLILKVAQKENFPFWALYCAKRPKRNAPFGSARGTARHLVAVSRTDAPFFGLAKFPYLS